MTHEYLLWLVVLSPQVLILSSLGGALLMAFPLPLKKRLAEPPRLS
jgi:hypothetical protein